MDYIDTILYDLPGVNKKNAKKKIQNIEGYRTTGGYTLEGLRGDALALSLAFSKTYEVFLNKLRQAELSAEWMERELLNLHTAFVEYYAVNKWVVEARAMGERYDNYDVVTVSKLSEYNGINYHGVVVQSPSSGSEIDIDRVESNEENNYSDTFVIDYALDFVCSGTSQPIVDVIFPSNVGVTTLMFCSLFPIGAGIEKVQALNESYVIDISVDVESYAGINVISFPRINCGGLRITFNVPKISMGNRAVYMSDIRAFNAEFDGSLNVASNQPEMQLSLIEPSRYKPAVYKPKFVWWNNG